MSQARRFPLGAAVLLLHSLVLPQHAAAFSIACSLGSKCVESQGTRIPSKKVLEMLEHCADFTQNGVGRQVLRMSLAEIQDRSRGNITHPIFAAHYAFDQLRDSPLAFDRSTRVEDTSYEQISRSCARLSSDFERWAK